MLKGYYRVPLSEEAKCMSSFITPDSLFQYTVTPFDLYNTPATFQRLMSIVTARLKGVHAY